MHDYSLTSDRQKYMDKYILLKDIPCAKKGTIFVHDKEDRIRGSIAKGCLKLAWTVDGNSQKSSPLCADSIVFHASAINETEWFKKLPSFEDKEEKLRNKIINKLKEVIECLESEWNLFITGGQISC